jgi:hypothetical protein
LIACLACSARDPENRRFVRQLPVNIAVEHRRQQLAPRQIAGGAEHHQHKRRHGYHAACHGPVIGWPGDFGDLAVQFRPES